MILFICFLMTAAQTSTDIYLPSFPAIQEGLATTNTNVQLIFALFLAGYALSQLFYGPLSDRYGRKPMLILGTSLFFLMSMVCVFSQSIEVLMVARVLQGIGCGVCSVVPRAIMRDVFQGMDLRKVNLYQSIAWAVVPIVAPLLGSYVQAYLGWRYNFVLLTLFSLLSFYLCVFIYKETLHEKASSLNVQAVLQGYRQILLNIKFWPYLLCEGSTFGLVNAFVVASPILIQENLGYSVVTYGWLLFLIAMVYIISAFVTKILLEKFNELKIIALGVAITALGVLALLLSVMAVREHIVFLLISASLLQVGVAFLFPACAANAIEPFAKHAGKAAALLGCFSLLIGALSSVAISYLPEVSFKYLLIVYIVNMIMMAWGYVVIINRKERIEYADNFG
jgi:Bcr/CflA subfamily drug resistance transporter